MKKLFDHIYNLGFRGLAIGGKFLLVFYIGKEMSTEELGVFGMFYSSVFLSIFIIGLSFYSFSNRDVIARPKELQFNYLKDQFVLNVSSYTILIPLILLVFVGGFLPYTYVWYFFAVLLFEYISQEFFRLLVLFSRPAFANAMLFVRMGLWVYILLAYFIFCPVAEPSLINVWQSWLVANIISAILSGIKIYSIFENHKMLPIDWGRIKKGLMVSMHFFGATISYKVIEFSNRYLLDFWYGKEELGVYTFYNQIANVINIVIYTVVIMIIYPKFLIAANDNNGKQLKKLMKSMMSQILILGGIIGVALVFGLKPIITLMDKAEFYDQISIFYYLLISNLIFNTSLVYHYKLYAYKKDKTILWTTLSGALMNIVLNVILIHYFGLQGAVISMLASYSVIFILKYYYARRIKILEN